MVGLIDGGGAVERRVDVDRADRQLIGQAAARLRRDAIAAEYRGAPAKHHAFAAALVLD